MHSISLFVVFRGGVEGLSSSMRRNYARPDELPLQDRVMTKLKVMINPWY